MFIRFMADSMHGFRPAYQSILNRGHKEAQRKEAAKGTKLRKRFVFFVSLCGCVK